MKPTHEETWSVRRDTDASPPKVVNEGGETVATMTVHYRADGKWHVPQHEEAVRRAVLAAASPDMARALLEVLEWDLLTRENPDAPAKHPRESVQAALRKAGVVR